MKNNNENYDLADVISTAFDILGFNAPENFKNTCKDKVCQCKDTISKKLDEKKEDIKKAFTPLVNMTNTEIREHLDGDNYSLMVVATGYDETMVKIQVNPDEGTLSISSDIDVDAIWFMPNINMSVNLPKGIRYSTLKKDIRNGMITITGKVNPVERTNRFVL